MTKNSHTPGPWVVEPRQWDQGASLAIVAPANGFIVAIVPFDEDIQTEDCPTADTVKRHPDEIPNANVLAAAPVLLEAGEEVIASWEKGDLAAAVRKLDSAIAKARRQQ
jgi:hypothetical protein